ncbi:ATP-dependent DNA helicase RecG [Rhodohalobacter barkolensis]|uniref:ATP-dependent DNA helicase RecG n=1 Tax=Rhodohalobacter barkolensis TaxID=2053187 RepID=A0A2N0VFK9_9BACT|nr:ATP-dependent DNA helicase RecG [Rhodohalobacter barkolensis]PKD42972.1 ATP-dependent DNA helicase RecG [Rhodohalobacter barkolensis]
MKLLDLHNLSQKRLAALQSAGIHHPEDLLMFFPRRYIDKSNFKPIGFLSETGEPVSVAGKVQSVNVTGYKNKRRLDVIIRDESGSMKAVYFKGWKYFINRFKKGSWVALYGTVKQYGRYMSMAHPEVDEISGPDDVEKFQSLIPIYPSNKHFSKAYITNQLVTDWVQQILSSTTVPEFLPNQILERHKFPIRDKALHYIHQPENINQSDRALERFKYEEFFLFELSMAKIKNIRISRAEGKILKPGELTKNFFNNQLPFKLTEGQKNSLKDIRVDLQSGKQMNRLIQGDVGAGKTVVAIGSMLMAVDNGMQAALMAPTEILAEQHYHTIKEYLEPLGINHRLITGSQSAPLRRDILSDIAGGTCQIAVGTHAIFQDKVEFNRLGLVVIDEQHRFGVKQRNELLLKGNNPHLLVMSATPIPRSLAMTIYSDLDISIIEGLPGGRKPIKTAVRTDKERPGVYNFLEESIKKGDQAYIVYPLIEESEAMDLKDATMGFEKLKRRFPDFRIGLLHGRLKPEEKDGIMKRFSEGEIDILVSTTVIEVGVDVPNASIMIIEHAERFGLSQLHQLRGRIGRGRKQSYCILMPGQKLSKDGRYRLKMMIDTTDGFKIAEADLKLRGPGDFLGTKQSGLPEFKYGDILEDRITLEQAKNDAWQIVRTDNELSKPEHKSLKKVFEPYFKTKAEFFGIG